MKVMTEQTPISFDKLLGDFNQTVAAQRSAGQTEDSLKTESHVKWKELSVTRDRMLDAILKEKGLALCSHNASSHLESKKWLKIHQDNQVTGKIEIDLQELKKVSPGELGIFSRDQMKLHFRRFTSLAYNGNPYLEGEYQFDELELLCRKHFETRNEAYHTAYWVNDKKGDWDIDSEVKEKDGRLMTVLGNPKIDVDVTDMPIEQTRDEMVYRYFGLPSLPPKPEF